MADNKKNSNEPELVTFGCRLNGYESEVMRKHALEAGLKDTVIINTCAVTKEAERQARQAIRKLRKERPEVNIVVTGCAAQIDSESFSKMDEVDRIIGNDIKLEASAWHDKNPERIKVNDIMAVKETAHHLISGLEGHTRAFIQVQNGCDHRCTFCIIPYGRGNSRSVPIGEIVRQVQHLVEEGYHEVVLTGVDVTSYGPDLPGKPSLGQMIRRLLNLVPDLPRLRLSSLDPVEIDEDLWQLIADEPRLMPHLHLSVQAGDDMILKRMKRRHLRDDVLSVCKRARKLRPDMAFGADMIAGFPTETDEMFENSLALIKECGLSYMHVFPYSARPGTPAARMPQVKGNIVKERAKKLREAGGEVLNKFLDSMIGKTAQILVEKNNMGHTEEFISVKLLKDVEAGQLLTVKLQSIENDYMIGDIL